MAPDRGLKSSARAWEDVVPALPSWIVDAMLSMNFPKMTPVQASTIPLFLAHKDVVVEAVTGSGKTLAFLIPLVDRILRIEETTKKHHVAAVVISPTRELATQIHSVLHALLAFHGPSAAAIDASKRLFAREYEDEVESDESAVPAYPAHTPKVLPQLLLGGSSTAAQDLSKFLKISPNVLISTPGRLLEILSSPYVHAPQSSFEVLVLDEADRLLDLGFKDDLTKILALLPKQRRTGLFSASISEAVDQIIRVGLRNPVRIAVKVKGANGVQDKKTPASLKMTYLLTNGSQKMLALKELLHKVQPQPLRTIVYLSTCAAVDYYQHLLPLILPSGMTLVPLHGKHPSNVREKNFAKFANTPSPTVLLTTDVAARGLDVAFVDLVIQVDPPSDPKAFIHRCGRAGRAGRKGLSVVFLQPGREEEYIPFLEVRKTPIEKLSEPDIQLDLAEALEITERLRSLVLQDRALHDKAQRAFVSWVRSYSKHQASSIFRVADLNWPELAQGWALLKLPKMPEAQKSDLSALDVPKVDWENYSYKDKSREKVRKENLANPRDTQQERPVLPKRTVADAWSEKQEQKTNREVKRSKREARKEYIRTTKMTGEEKDRTAETQQMIAKVREQQRIAREEDDNFEGFE